MKPLQMGGFGLLLGLALWSVVPGLAQTQDDAHFLATLGELREASYSDKHAIAQRIIQGSHPKARQALTALLEDRLAYRNSDQKIFLLKSADGDPLTLIDPASLAEAGTTPADSVSKIGTNNSLRRSLRTALARFSLTNADPAVRIEAVRGISQSLDATTLQLLRDQLAAEQDSRVKAEINLAVAIGTLDSEDPRARISAVKTLRSTLSQEVRNRLARLIEEEKDANVKAAAIDAVGSIDVWRTAYSGIETLFFGLSLGSVLVLIAMGLAITFGVVGVINMAHGELMMLGAYTTYLVQVAMPDHIGISVLVAIPAAFLVSGATGVIMERSIIRLLYNRPLETLLATFGVSLVLQQTVRSIFSALNRSVKTPGWMSGSLRINDALTLTYNRLYIVLFALIVFACVLLALKKTRLGLMIRAVSQNRGMAKAMGIRTEWVDAMTFGLGSGIAGVAGVALSQLTNVGPNLGQAYIIDSFMVVVFGGVGNLWGSLIGGMSMGIVSNLLEPYAGAVLAKILVLIALIIFIQRRPRGLFPQTGRAAEDK
ncbi:MAG: urea ABC transporter permease subunit UrtB [Bryobacterales bacterium]|nr:urea ABC transporter permease subunit UrtB [Bryobacterales bacterium]